MVLIRADQENGSFPVNPPGWRTGFPSLRTETITCSHTRGICRVFPQCAPACAGSGETGSWRQSYTHRIWRVFLLQNIKQCCTWILTEIWKWKAKPFKRKLLSTQMLSSSLVDCSYSWHMNIHSQSEQVRRYHWFLFLCLNGNMVYIM